MRAHAETRSRVATRPMLKPSVVVQKSLKTKMRLILWTATEVEEYLTGPGILFRQTYFGELILTPDGLRTLHKRSVASIKERWLPDVHQVLHAERIVDRALGSPSAWADLSLIEDRLRTGSERVASAVAELPAELATCAGALLDSATSLRASLARAYAGLTNGATALLREQPLPLRAPTNQCDIFVRRLRSAGKPLSLDATNLLADTYAAQRELRELNHALAHQFIVIAGRAGYGKTQIAAQVTAATDDRPPGLLLFGRDLHAGHNLDSLAQRVVFNGVPVPSFEALLAAVDAAGQRSGRRLPLFIDGLNEAEDPRDWKPALAPLADTLQRFPNLVVVCTIRPEFTEEALPDGTECLELSGFNEDLDEAIDRYLHHYRIDRTDALFPMRLLDHPLLLRVFCEVANPTRKQTVGVEAIPTSLTALFERYLEQSAGRVQDLSPRSCRVFRSDVRTAVNAFGMSLWRTGRRSIPVGELRKLLSDDGRPWDQSIVQALESEGVLIRWPSEQKGPGDAAFVYDALAGHVVADAMLSSSDGNEIDSWLRTQHSDAVSEGISTRRHPLVGDIFDALIGLFPRRRHRQQFWPLLQDPLRTQAIRRSALLEPDLLDGDTVRELGRLTATLPGDLFQRLQDTRGARTHPLNSEFLDSVLRSMMMPDRDLCWSEWLRCHRVDIIDDLTKLGERWKRFDAGQASEVLRARWVMWTLTSSVRLLRDHATRALYRFGCNDPRALFDLSLESLQINDPYVPERMLASCYGVAVSLWTDPRGQAVRDALPAFAKALLKQMFLPNAPYSTRHVLMRDSVLGIIALAQSIDAACIPEPDREFLEPPFEHLPSFFPDPAAITDETIAGAQDAIHMDFGNYTIGGLIPDRGNYNYSHPVYQDVRKQIEARIVELGYSSDRFGAIDKTIATEDSWSMKHERPKMDRYGKKYSWIAYFEMYGWRLDHDQLPDWRAVGRCADVDIDPSFPEAPRNWKPELPDVFSDTPTAPRAWLQNGPRPSYEHLLSPAEVDSDLGPWVLLDGYIEQSAPMDGRRVFTFLRGVLIEGHALDRLLAAFGERAYPGNSAIPDSPQCHYTYAGEIPWSKQFIGEVVEDSTELRIRREAFEHYDGSEWRRTTAIECPVCRFGWESYHSRLNQNSNVLVPAPALCERLQLVRHSGDWDMYDGDGRRATLYRCFRDSGDTFGSDLIYCRGDLLRRYLVETEQALVWLVWGERGLHFDSITDSRDRQLSDVYNGNGHVHKWSHTWKLDDPGL